MAGRDSGRGTRPATGTETVRALPRCASSPRYYGRSARQESVGEESSPEGPDLHRWLIEFHRSHRADDHGRRTAGRSETGRTACCSCCRSSTSKRSNGRSTDSASGTQATAPSVGSRRGGYYHEYWASMEKGLRGADESRTARQERGEDAEEAGRAGGRGARRWSASACIAPGMPTASSTSSLTQIRASTSGSGAAGEISTTRARSSRWSTRHPAEEHA